MNKEEWTKLQGGRLARLVETRGWRGYNTPRTFERGANDHRIERLKAKDIPNAHVGTAVPPLFGW